MDLALNNLQRMTCHKTQKPNQTRVQIICVKWKYLSPSNYVKIICVRNIDSILKCEIYWCSIEILEINCSSYLPTPPLGQDMTQGQFLSGVLQV